VCCALPARAAAAPVVLDFDSVPPPPWEIWDCDGTGASSVASGVLTIESPSCHQVDLDHPLGEWHAGVSNAKGWVIETRVFLDPASEYVGEGSLRLWVHDHTHLLVFGISPGEFQIQYPTFVTVQADTTDGFHIYRIVGVLDQIRVYLDGVLLLSDTVPPGGEGTDSLSFGDGVGAAYSLSYWDYFWYDVEGCAEGQCDPGGVCAEGSPCDDGDACTGPDACQAGVCAGAPVTCPAPDACHEAACRPDAGCVSGPMPDGAPCAGGACVDGSCVTGPEPGAAGGGDEGAHGPPLYGRGVVCATGGPPAPGGARLLVGVAALAAARRRGRRRGAAARPPARGGPLMTPVLRSREAGAGAEAGAAERP
jgi:hypothetical protein